MSMDHKDYVYKIIMKTSFKQSEIVNWIVASDFLSESDRFYSSLNLRHWTGRQVGFMLVKSPSVLYKSHLLILYDYIGSWQWRGRRKYQIHRNRITVIIQYVMVATCCEYVIQERPCYNKSWYYMLWLMSPRHQCITCKHN
jgi:hypothetical protein